MCSVGFDSQFGMNVKMYQQMQRTKFGMGVRSSGFNPQLSMNTGIFTAGKPNLFAANNTSSLNFNGVQYDNKYAMLNSVGNDDKNAQGADKSFKDILKDAGSVIKEAFSSIGEEIKSGFNSAVKFVKNLFGGKKSDAAKNGSEIGKQSLNDIQNAQDKATLNQALQSANNDNQAVQQNLQNDNKALKTSQNQEAKAQQGAESAEAGLDEANQGLDGANQELNNAQTEVQNAEQGLQTAKTNVATAQQALDAAKAAATPENPNSAAIAKAQSDLNTAKQEEQLAQKKLDEAKQRETQAQEGVSASEQEVQVSEQQNTEAQAGLEQAVSNTEAAEADLEASEVHSQEINDGIKSGEEKMNQFEATEMQEGQVQYDVHGADPEQPSVGMDMLKDQDNLINSKGYTDDQKAEILKARQDIQNMQPGQTIKCGADTYTMDADGTIRVNDTAGEYNDKDMAAVNAGESAMRGIDAKKQSDAELAALRGTENAPVENGKKEIDTKTPGAKWSKTVSASGEGFSSREKVIYERNSDGTITENSVRGTRILDADGKKVIRETSKRGGLNSGRLEVDYQAGTRTTDVGSMKGSSSAGYAITRHMEKASNTDNTVFDKDGNVFVTYKDGQYYNTKGRKISQDKAVDLINKHKDEGLKYVQARRKKA